MYRSRRRGLTPSETLIAAAVVAAFALMLTWRFAGDPEVEARELTIERMRLVMDELEKYAIDNGGVFPTTDQGLNALLQRPTKEPRPIRWRGPYLPDAAVLADAWGSPLIYVAPGDDARPFDLWSNGADRAEGGAGAEADIQSWQPETLIP